MKKLSVLFFLCCCVFLWAQVPPLLRGPWTTNTPGSINAFATNTTVITNLHVKGPTDSLLLQVNTNQFAVTNKNAIIGPLGVLGQGKVYGTPANNFSGYVQPYNQGDGYTRIWNTGPFGIFFGVDDITRMRLDSPGNLSLNFAGAYFGNGSGLTNLPASSITNLGNVNWTNIVAYGGTLFGNTNGTNAVFIDGSGEVLSNALGIVTVSSGNLSLSNRANAALAIQPTETNVLFNVASPAAASSPVMSMGTNGEVGIYGASASGKRLLWVGTNAPGVGLPCLAITNGGANLWNVAIGTAPNTSYSLSTGRGIDAGSVVQCAGFRLSSVLGNQIYVSASSTGFPAIIYSRANTNIWKISDAAQGASGCSLIFDSMYFDPTQCESTTNTVLYSQGTNFLIGDNLTVPSLKANGVVNVGSNITASGTINASNGVLQNIKFSFTTNFTASTNFQFYCANGTNQLITLPDATKTAGTILRFSSTNGNGNFIVTNATGSQTIRDGTNLSIKNIGVGDINLVSDGAAWWIAGKTKTIFPTASWSCSTNIPFANTGSNHITFDTLEFNNSQGIALITTTTPSESHLWITNAGQYMLTYSAVLKAGHANDVLSLWLGQDNTNVLRSRTDQIIASTAGQQCQTVNFILNVTGTTSFEILGHASATGCFINSGAADATMPAMPSVIMTINRISDGTP